MNVCILRSRARAIWFSQSCCEGRMSPRAGRGGPRWAGNLGVSSCMNHVSVGTDGFLSLSFIHSVVSHYYTLSPTCRNLLDACHTIR